MKTLLLISLFAGSVSFAAENPPAGPSTTSSATMPGSAQAQLDMTKKDIMGKCMSMKKSEAACKDMMRSCGDAKLQSCMNEKMGVMAK